jgi:hypothetical protein
VIVFVEELQLIKKIDIDKKNLFKYFIYYFTIPKSSISKINVEEGGMTYSPFLTSEGTPLVP